MKFISLILTICILFSLVNLGLGICCGDCSDYCKQYGHTQQSACNQQCGACNAQYSASACNACAQQCADSNALDALKCLQANCPLPCATYCTNYASNASIGECSNMCDSCNGECAKQNAPAGCATACTNCAVNCATFTTPEAQATCADQCLECVRACPNESTDCYTACSVTCPTNCQNSYTNEGDCITYCTESVERCDGDATCIGGIATCTSGCQIFTDTQDACQQKCNNDCILQRCCDASTTPPQYTQTCVDACTGCVTGACVDPQGGQTRDNCLTACTQNVQPVGTCSNNPHHALRRNNTKKLGGD